MEEARIMIVNQRFTDLESEKSRMEKKHHTLQKKRNKNDVCEGQQSRFTIDNRYWVFGLNGAPQKGGPKPYLWSNTNKADLATQFMGHKQIEYTSQVQ